MGFNEDLLTKWWGGSRRGGMHGGEQAPMSSLGAEEATPILVLMEGVGSRYPGPEGGHPFSPGVLPWERTVWLQTQLLGCPAHNPVLPNRSEIRSIGQRHLCTLSIVHPGSAVQTPEQAQTGNRTLSRRTLSTVFKHLRSGREGSFPLHAVMLKPHSAVLH